MTRRKPKRRKPKYGAHLIGFDEDTNTLHEIWLEPIPYWAKPLFKKKKGKVRLCRDPRNGLWNICDKPALSGDDVCERERCDIRLAQQRYDETHGKLKK